MAKNTSRSVRCPSPTASFSHRPVLQKTEEALSAYNTAGNLSANSARRGGASSFVHLNPTEAEKEAFEHKPFERPGASYHAQWIEEGMVVRSPLQTPPIGAYNPSQGVKAPRISANLAGKNTYEAEANQRLHRDLQIFLLHATVALSMVEPELAKACIALRKKIKNESPAFSSFMRHNLNLLFNIALHFNKITPLHRDLDSSPFSLDHIGAAGFFEGAELYFSCANILVPFQPFVLCLIRGFCLMHGVCALRGGVRRFSVASFLNKSVFEHYRVPIPRPSEYNIHVPPPNFTPKHPEYDESRKTINEEVLKMTKLMEKRLERERKGEYGKTKPVEAEISTNDPRNNNTKKSNATKLKREHPKAQSPPPPTAIISPSNSPPRKKVKRNNQPPSLFPTTPTPSSSRGAEPNKFNQEWQTDDSRGDGATSDEIDSNMEFDSDCDSDTLPARVYEKYIRRELVKELPDALDALEDSEVCQRWVRLGVPDSTTLPDFLASMGNVTAINQVSNEGEESTAHGKAEGEAVENDEDDGNDGDDEVDESREDDNGGEQVDNEAAATDEYPASVVGETGVFDRILKRGRTVYVEVPPRQK